MRAEEIASTLYSIDPVSFELDDVVKTVNKMIERGSRYINLERELGKGVTFVLGMTLSETYWTKLIGKSGPNFDDATQRAREWGVLEAASEWAELRQQTIDVKMKEIRAALLQPVPPVAPMPLSMPQGFGQPQLQPSRAFVYQGDNEFGEMVTDFSDLSPFFNDTPHQQQEMIPDFDYMSDSINTNDPQWDISAYYLPPNEYNEWYEHTQ